MGKLEKKKKAIFLKWKIWGEKKAEEEDNQGMKEFYIVLAAKLCLDAIKQLLKKEK